MTDIYLTSTFTNPWNVEFNKKLEPLLEAAGLTCYFAHRDTNQNGTAEERFAQDIAGMDNARCVLAIAMNESPNFGAEVGYAYGLKKPVIALTDTTHKIPLICAGMTVKTVRHENLDDIESYLSDLAGVIRSFL